MQKNLLKSVNQKAINQNWAYTYNKKLFYSDLSNKQAHYIITF